jgi:hypothetical protein
MGHHQVMTALNRVERSPQTTRLMMGVSWNNNSVICKNTFFGYSAPQMLASDVKIDLIVLCMRMRFWREPVYVIYITVYVNKQYFCV